MTRDEIAAQLIIAVLTRSNSIVDLANPRPKWWTTNPPPAIYLIVENALWIADSLLAPPKPQEPTA